MTRGLDLAERFYHRAVLPVLEAWRPLPHTACLVGAGSEVLGYDDELSTDHDWGPRLQLLLHPDDHAAHADALVRVLAERLPPQLDGWSVHFAPPDDDDGGTRVRSPHLEGPVAHRVEVLTPASLVERLLGRRAAGLAAGRTLTTAEWLAAPQQQLLALTAGRVLRDDVGLGRVRDALAWYPDDVWRYLMAAAWSQVGEDEHLAPRAGHAGDDLGSRLVTARLVRTLMQLAFLQERRYAPYAKWFGTAFGRLAAAAEVGPHLRAALEAPGWTERNAQVAAAAELLGRRHDALGLTAPLRITAHAFHDRPFTVVGGERAAAALLDGVTDTDVRRLADLRPIGGVDQVTASTDVLVDPTWRDRLTELYELGPTPEA
ncbi:DUF4037 domain-containing protein [Actinotalea ferrariae]|uniref:DUF4037 domain-containing protein n=1 Tax=Actinotalea ferrariae TaxID=1386098 RepID=UPI001C8CB46C|nr:DUF4037 domain-containing protein [Actinotalea ferrariae]MBX9244493.1 DUF4037 domain-containing protein [Actinotalea ferrariae]